MYGQIHGHRIEMKSQQQTRLKLMPSQLKLWPFYFQNRTFLLEFDGFLEQKNRKELQLVKRRSVLVLNKREFYRRL